MKTLSLFIILFCNLNAAVITEIFLTKTSRVINFQELLNEIENHDIVVLGENHDNEFQHQTQLKLISETRSSTPKSVGFEFINFEQNQILQDYLLGKFSDEEFQKLINWGSIPFAFYKPLIIYAPSNQGVSLGLNVPSSITRKISRNSIDSLTEIEKMKYLPQNFELGNDLYREKFKETFKDHPIPDKDFLNYFTAQSLWDDMMAYQTSLFVTSTPAHKFFIIIGNFHAEHGLGLPSRINKRIMNRRLLNIVQVDENHYTSDELKHLKSPHAKYGNLADIIIFSK